METLIAVSSVLQRERTALKVMMQLLVSRRADLVLGDIIPVGDLFDVIADGDEPFTEDMRIHFDNAKRLYVQKLVPLLEREAGMARAQVEALAANDPCVIRFRTDDRLIKTLLLAALVPEVDALKNMTPRRLAALVRYAFLQTRMFRDPRAGLGQRECVIPQNAQQETGVHGIIVNNQDL